MVDTFVHGGYIRVAIPSWLQLSLEMIRFFFAFFLKTQVQMEYFYHLGQWSFTFFKRPLDIIKSTHHILGATLYTDS